MVVAEQYKVSSGGEAFLLFLGILYCFAFLAIVCEEFFVPSLEVLAERCDLSEDVAGATFMAAGGSAPEFFTSLIGSMWLTETDVGVGTILGSAVFNVLFVIGVCGIVAPGILKLSWWPLFRDCCWYALALFFLTLTFLDGRVYPAEAAFLFSVYVGSGKPAVSGLGFTPEEIAPDAGDTASDATDGARPPDTALRKGGARGSETTTTAATKLPALSGGDENPIFAPLKDVQDHMAGGASASPPSGPEPTLGSPAGRSSATTLKKTQSFDDGGSRRNFKIARSSQHHHTTTTTPPPKDLPIERAHRRDGSTTNTSQHHALKRHDSLSSSTHLGGEGEKKKGFKFRRARANTITNLLNEPNQLALLQSRQLVEQGKSEDGAVMATGGRKRAWDSVVTDQPPPQRPSYHSGSGTKRVSLDERRSGSKEKQPSPKRRGTEHQPKLEKIVSLSAAEERELALAKSNQLGGGAGAARESGPLLVLSEEPRGPGERDAAIQRRDISPTPEACSSGSNTGQPDCDLVEEQSSRSSSAGGGTIRDHERLHDGAALELDEDEAVPLELTFPTSWKRRLIFVITFPILLILLYSVPDVRRGEFWRRWYLVTFLMSLVYISLAASFMVKWAAILATFLGLEVRILGLTVLAAGTSVPDLLASVIVAKMGKGDMAVSSSIGSNIFDVLVGLPVPWMVYSAVNDGNPMGIYTNNMVFSTLVLLLMLVSTIGIIIWAKWILSRQTGYLMLVLYVLFIVQACALSVGEVEIF
eukprot:g7256.t1